MKQKVFKALSLSKVLKRRIRPPRAHRPAASSTEPSDSTILIISHHIHLSNHNTNTDHIHTLAQCSKGKYCQSAQISLGVSFYSILKKKESERKRAREKERKRKRAFFLLHCLTVLKRIDPYLMMCTIQQLTALKPAPAGTAWLYCSFFFNGDPLCPRQTWPPL